MKARWPKAGKVDNKLLRSSEYLMNSAHEFRLRFKNFMVPPKGKVRFDTKRVVHRIQVVMAESSQCGLVELNLSSYRLVLVVAG